MTKKSKIEVTQPVIDDQPIANPAVVEEPASTVLDAKVIVPKSEKPQPVSVTKGVSLDVPWCYPAEGHKLKGVRAPNYTFDHAPVVQIAGVSYEPTEVNLEDLSEDVRMAIREQTFIRNLDFKGLTTSRWDPAKFAELIKSDVFKCYFLNIDSVDIYITTGSELIVDQSLFRTNYTFGGVKGYKPNKDASATLIIIGSHIHVDELNAYGAVQFLNSDIESKHVLTIHDSKVQRCFIRASDYTSIITSELYKSRMLVADSISVESSLIRRFSVSGFNSLTLTNIEGVGEFEFSAWGMPGLAFQANDTYLSDFEYNCAPPPEVAQMDIYKPVAKTQSWINGNIVNVTRRIDYGTFAGTQPIQFVRLNDHDLLVGGTVFSVQDFFPEFITKKESKTFESSERSSFGPFLSTPAPYYSTGPGYYNRESELWLRAAAIAFGGNKPVIGKLGESIVNGLLDQIRSRINVYVEISTLN